MRSFILSIAAIAMLALPSPTTAQGPGRLSGRVKDEAGKPLAGVTATVINSESGKETTQVTNRKGRVTIAVLDPDPVHTIVLSKEGYQTIREEVRLKRGDPALGDWIMVAGQAEAPPPGLELTAEEMARSKAAVEHYNAGAQAFNAGDLAAAAASFDAAITEDPELLQAYEIGSVIHYRLENHDRALELVAKVLEADPTNSRALGVRYDAYNALANEAEADAALDALLATSADIDTARRTYNRGLSHAKNADIESAIPRLEQALAIEPGLAPAWGLLGDLEIARGNYARAIECGDHLIELEGSRERGLSLRHRAFEAMGDEAGAAEALRALADENPDAVMSSLFERANDLFDNNDSEGAAKLYRQVLDLQPDNPRAHYKLGLALLSLDDAATAKSHLERFIELAPEDPEAASARDMLSYLN